jgi:hypothetical protein
VALEVGIVGLPSSGKSMLFEALTGVRASGEVGMAAIPDPRLQQLAKVVQARKITPAAIRVSEVRGAGPALLGNLRHPDVLLAGAVRLSMRQRTKQRRLARARQPDDPDLQRHCAEATAARSASAARRARGAGAT